MSDEVAARSTELLRGSDESPWPRLRELLSTEGFEPSEVALAQFFPDDVDMEFGILVSRDGRVHEFELHYGAKGDLKRQLESAFLWGLAEHTDDWRNRPFSDDVRAAVALLEAERRPRGTERTR